MDFTKLKIYIDTLDSLGVPYCDVSVRLNREEVFRHSMGYVDTEKTKKPTRNTIQWMYSMSKVVACSAVLRLVEKGLLGLEDKVSKYLPEYEHLKVKKGDEVVDCQTPLLIRHLFSMRSGIDYDWGCILEDMKNPNASTRELVAGISRKTLLFEPDTDYVYGLSHDILAAVAEVITGMKWRDYLKQEIFEPLGLKNIGFHPTQEQKANFAQQFELNFEVFRSHPRSNDNDFRFTDDYDSGGAGLFSTLDDYMEIADALANGGVAKNGYRILNPETISLMCTDQQTENSKSKMKLGYGYGLGVRVLKDKVEGKALSPLGEFGWDGAAASDVRIDPKNHLTIVFTTHITAAGVLFHTAHPYIRNLVYEALGLAEEY